MKGTNRTKYVISTYNEVTWKKDIRYVVTSRNLKECSDKLWKEVELMAHTVVLIEKLY